MNIHLLDQQTLQALRDTVTTPARVVVCCHESPDGDALGSTLAWAEFLRQKGQQATVIIPDAYPDFFKWVPGIEDVVIYEKQSLQTLEQIMQAEIIYCLDFNTLGRLGCMQNAVENSNAKFILIDHHLAPDIKAEMSVSHDKLCSTSEIVFRLIDQLGGFSEMTNSMATNIYCGMMTDTGGFTYNSTYPEIYHIIGQLLTKGIDKDRIFRNVYNNYSANAIRLRGYIMSRKLHVYDQLHASYFTVSRRDMHYYHFIKGDAEGLVNEPLKIKGMKLSISLREDDRHDNTIWVSLRSVDDFPANKMAEQFFNGGGHLNASGGRLYCSLQEAEAVVKKAFKHYENMLKA